MPAVWSASGRSTAYPSPDRPDVHAPNRLPDPGGSSVAFARQPLTWRCARSPSTRPRSSTAARARSRASRSSASCPSRCCSPTPATAISKASARSPAPCSIRSSARSRCPARRVAWVGRYFADKAHAGRRERRAAPGAHRAGAGRRRRFPQLRDENARLKTLLDLQARYGGAGRAVEVLYTGRDPFTQKVFVNKGLQAGIAAGEAVLDDRGVVGQVTRVFPVHGGGDARHRQGPGRAREGRAQRRAQRAVRQRRRPRARAALHRADRRHAGRRPAAHVGHRRHLSAEPAGGRGRSTSSATPARCSRASPRGRWPASIARSTCSCSGQAAAARRRGRKSRPRPMSSSAAAGPRPPRMRALSRRGLVRARQPGGDPPPAAAVVRAAHAAARARRQHGAGERRVHGAASRLPRRRAALLVHPGAALRGRGHRVVLGS